MTKLAKIMTIVTYIFIKLQIPYSSLSLKPHMFLSLRVILHYLQGINGAILPENERKTLKSLLSLHHEGKGKT